MLRGFDQGYDIPSLAIIIHPEYRQMGLGMLLMSFLHAEARIRKVSRVRLKVYPHNTAACNLYKQVGYNFSGKEGDQLIGYYSTGICP
jgi:ribosomal protein S18 acetylase RimI-like enzyme